MASFVEPSEKAGSAGHTDQSRGKRVGETHSSRGRIIHVGRVNSGVNRRSHEVVLSDYQLIEK